MANRKVLQYPSQVLNEKSLPVDLFDDSFRQLVQDMYDTNNVKMGVGLAAPQISEKKRVVIINCARLGTDYVNPEPIDELGDPQQLVLVNPVLELSGPKHSWKEACLSLPGVAGTVERSQFVSLKFQNYYGKECHIELDWPLSGVIQHECDHLDGILFVRRMRGISRTMLLKRYQKKQKKIKEMIKSMTLPSLDDEAPTVAGTMKSRSSLKKKRPKKQPKKNHLKKKKKKKKR